MDLARSIEQTRLAANTTEAQIDELCSQALEWGFGGVCVNPAFVPRVARAVDGRVRVVSVVGFPLGSGSEASDLAEATWLVENGADEIDMVVPLAAACAGDYRGVETRVAAVRRVVDQRVLKVILETCYFDPAQLTSLARSVLGAGPDYLKTSTGFGPGGATVADVRLLAQLGQGSCLVKASGGIRSLSTARQMLTAGASRLGTSSGHLIMAELRSEKNDAPH